jgi:Tol biopolymer transport system component
LSSSQPSQRIFYRLNTNASYLDYTSPLPLTNDVVIQYYGSNKASHLRSRLYTAAYSFGRGGSPPPLSPVDIAPGTTNPAPIFQTNKVILSDIGTVFYGRRSAGGAGTIWAINLDGSGETFITTGSRPRVSRDGQWMAFLREGDPFNNKGNIWVRNIVTGLETRLFVSNPNPAANTNTIVCYDWDLSNTNLVFDYDNQFRRLGLEGLFQQFPLAADYNQGAPAINPHDRTVAFQVLYPGASGLYLSDSSLTFKNFILGYPSGARWPSWSPDGEYLALASGLVSPSVDDGKDLWVAEMNGGVVSNLFQITALSSGDSFPHGALWSPGGDALVGAGTIFGTNGIWIIPLSTDCMCSDDPIVRLPTAPGDPIDFVGSIITAPENQGSVQPGLFIRSDPDTDSLIVYWSAAYLNFTLETTFDLSTTPIIWTEIPGPYDFDGYLNQYTIPISSLLQKQFFRLHYTGAKQ